MKVWMMLAFAAVVFVGMVSILDYQKGVRATEAEAQAQAEWDRVYQEGMQKAADAELQAKLKRMEDDAKAKGEGARREHLENMKIILRPGEYLDYKRDLERADAESEARALQEAQLEELREIKERMPK